MDNTGPCRQCEAPAYLGLINNMHTVMLPLCLKCAAELAELWGMTELQAKLRSEAENRNG